MGKLILPGSGQNGTATGLPLDDMRKQLMEQIASIMGVSHVHMFIAVHVPANGLVDYSTSMKPLDTKRLLMQVVASYTGGGSIIKLNG